MAIDPPRNAFETSKPECNVPFVPKIDGDLVDTCDVNPAPPPIWETDIPEFPSPPSYDYGCYLPEIKTVSIRQASPGEEASGTGTVEPHPDIGNCLPQFSFDFVIDDLNCPIIGPETTKEAAVESTSDPEEVRAGYSIVRDPQAGCGFDFNLDFTLPCPLCPPLRVKEENVTTTIDPEAEQADASVYMTPEVPEDDEEYDPCRSPCEWDFNFDFTFPEFNCPEIGVTKTGSDHVEVEVTPGDNENVSACDYDFAFDFDCQPISGTITGYLGADLTITPGTTPDCEFDFEFDIPCPTFTSTASSTITVKAGPPEVTVSTTPKVDDCGIDFGFDFQLPPVNCPVLVEDDDHDVSIVEGGSANLNVTIEEVEASSSSASDDSECQYKFTFDLTLPSGVGQDDCGPFRGTVAVTSSSSTAQPIKIAKGKVIIEDLPSNDEQLVIEIEEEEYCHDCVDGTYYVSLIIEQPTPENKSHPVSQTDAAIFVTKDDPPEIGDTIDTYIVPKGVIIIVLGIGEYDNDGALTSWQQKHCGDCKIRTPLVTSDLAHPGPLPGPGGDAAGVNPGDCDDCGAGVAMVSNNDCLWDKENVRYQGPFGGNVRYNYDDGDPKYLFNMEAGRFALVDPHSGKEELSVAIPAVTDYEVFDGNHLYYKIVLENDGAGGRTLLATIATGGIQKGADINSVRSSLNHSTDTDASEPDDFNHEILIHVGYVCNGYWHQYQYGEYLASIDKPTFADGTDAGKVWTLTGEGIWVLKTLDASAPYDFKGTVDSRASEADHTVSIRAGYIFLVDPTNRTLPYGTGSEETPKVTKIYCAGASNILNIAAAPGGETKKTVGIKLTWPSGRNHEDPNLSLLTGATASIVELDGAVDSSTELLETINDNEYIICAIGTFTVAAGGGSSEWVQHQVGSYTYPILFGTGDSSDEGKGLVIDAEGKFKLDYISTNMPFQGTAYDDEGTMKVDIQAGYVVYNDPTLVYSGADNTVAERRLTIKQVSNLDAQSGDFEIWLNVPAPTGRNSTTGLFSVGTPQLVKRSFSGEPLYNMADRSPAADDVMLIGYFYNNVWTQVFTGAYTMTVIPGTFDPDDEGLTLSMNPSGEMNFGPGIPPALAPGTVLTSTGVNEAPTWDWVRYL